MHGFIGEFLGTMILILLGIGGYDRGLRCGIFRAAWAPKPGGDNRLRTICFLPVGSGNALFNWAIFRRFCWRSVSYYSIPTPLQGNSR